MHGLNDLPGISVASNWQSQCQNPGQSDSGQALFPLQ